jgi:hypothetical protein
VWALAVIVTVLEIKTEITKIALGRLRQEDRKFNHQPG